MKILLYSFVLLLLLGIALGDDAYRPYLHTPVVPEHPELELFGEYDTQLYTGSASYSYELEVPPGTNGLTPKIGLSYTSQSKQIGVLGYAWNFHQDFIYLDTNHTPRMSDDDIYYLVMGGNTYPLVETNGEYKTKVDYYFKIQKYDSYWSLTTKDGIIYRFGYGEDQRIEETMWMLDLVTDTLNNTISYEYTSGSPDSNMLYLDTILYNRDQRRTVEFTYESLSNRPIIFQHGLFQEPAYRITSIQTFVDGELVHNYQLTYEETTPVAKVLSSISRLGSDNLTVEYSINFTYSLANNTYFNETNMYLSPSSFADGSGVDQGVRFVDVNYDSYVDIVKRKAGSANTYINNRYNGWLVHTDYNIPLDIVDGSGVDQGVRFVDLNGDGKIDILKASTSKSSYINTGDGWVSDSDYNSPINFVDGSGVDQGVRLADVNGDGKTDLIKSKSGSSKVVYIYDQGHWISQDTWNIPHYFVDGSGVDQGVRLADVNGDGLIDFLKSDTSTSNIYINNGYEWINYDLPIPVNFITGSNEDNNVRIYDVNDDGLVDLVQGTSNAWLNNGSGWTKDNNWTSPIDFVQSGQNTGTRIADVNGDGLADIIQHKTSTITHIRKQEYSHLISEIHNEYGGITSIEYMPSTEYDSSLSFSLPVVSSININTTRFLSEMNYTYDNISFDYSTNEFRGFGLVQEQVPDGEKNYYFYQDDARKGIEYKQEYFQDRLLSSSLSHYTFMYEDGIYNVTIINSSSSLYNDDNQSYTTAQSFTYDQFGNYKEIYDHGDLSIDGDELITLYEYALNVEDWIVDKVSRETVLTTDGETIRQTTYFYDNKGFKGVDLGLLSKEEMWNDQGSPTRVEYEYDSYGNVIARIDSLGNKDSYSYGPLHTYLISSINPLGHTVYFEYNLSNGNLLSQEENGVTTRYEYDVFGRITKEILPYDTTTSPTKEYEYIFDGQSPEKVVTTQKTDYEKNLSLTYYYDGFGNLIQLQTQSPYNSTIVQDFSYDYEGRVDYEYLPRFETSTTEFVSENDSKARRTYTYDLLGRVIQVEHPDTTTKQVSYDTNVITDYDENNNKKQYIVDGRGRITQVKEYYIDLLGIEQEFVTSYRYDDNDNLILIRDSQGNEFSFTYDSLGRKIAMDDPDLGSWNYTYDQNGNLISQTDAKQNQILLFYDSLNRIIEKNSGDVNISFRYDQDYFGTLSSIQQGDILFNYTYDDRRRILQELQTIDNFTFSQDFVYDSGNRILSLKGLNDIDYTYDSQGLVESIDGYVFGVEYTAFGGVASKIYTNGLTTTYSYNSLMNRLERIDVPSIQSLDYTYDDVGNILGIQDDIHNLTHTMTYDSLDRLRTAQIGRDTYAYTFDSIGNLQRVVKNNLSKGYVYDATPVHAPSAIIETSSGVGMGLVQELETNSKQRFFEYAVYSDDGNSLSNVVSTVEFGDGDNFTTTTYTVDENTWFFVEEDYTISGEYEVLAQVESSSSSFSQRTDQDFGITMPRLRSLSQEGSNELLELTISSNVDSAISGVSWNCSNGVSSSSSTTLTGLDSLLVFMEVDHTMPKKYDLNCDVISDEGDKNIQETFEVQGLAISEYDALFSQANTRVISYDVTNNFDELSTTLGIDTDFTNFTSTTNLDSGKSIMSFVEIDYTSDNQKEILIEASSGNHSVELADSFILRGVSVESYDRETTGSDTVLSMFDVYNDWSDGSIEWNINELGISNSSVISTDESIMVFIEKDFVEGDTSPTISTFADSYVDLIEDDFYTRPLLIQGLSSSMNGEELITSFTLLNTLDDSLLANWSLEIGGSLVGSGSQNISTSFSPSVSSTHAKGVYATKLTVVTQNYTTQSLGFAVVGLSGVISSDVLLRIADENDVSLALFGVDGDLDLKGSCSVESSCNASDLVVFKDVNGTVVASISSAGDLCLTSGSCSGGASSCLPDEESFVLKDSGGIVMSHIDFDGSICLRGGLNENAI